MGTLNIKGFVANSAASTELPKRFVLKLDVWFTILKWGVVEMFERWMLLPIN